MADRIGSNVQTQETTTAGVLSSTVGLNVYGGTNAQGSTTGATGAAGGANVLTAQKGGASTIATTGTGGAGGTLSLVAGAGGVGDTGGVGGSVHITAGAAGTVGNVNGGSIRLTAGVASSSGVHGRVEFGNAGMFVAASSAGTAPLIALPSGFSAGTPKWLRCYDVAADRAFLIGAYIET